LVPVCRPRGDADETAPPFAPVDYNSIQVKLALLALIVPALLAAPPERAGDPQELLRQAMAAHQSGDMPTAIRLYREILKDHPEVAEIRSNLGAALARDGQYAAAIPEYREALKKLSANPGIRLNLALAYYKLGRLPEAATELQAVHKAQPETLQPVYLLGDCWLQMGETQKVIDLLTEFDRKYPQDMAITYMLGTALLREKRTNLAQLLLDRILSKGESAESALLLGFSLYQLHDNKAAAVQLARAVQLNPNLPTVHALYAQCLKETGDSEGAAEQFRQELKLNPYDYVSNMETALLLKQDGKLDEALACIERALLVRPGDPGALYQQASTEMLRGKVEVARGQLEKLVKEYPNFTEAHVSLAAVYYRLKRREDGDRERAMVRQLQEEEQKREAAKQNGKTEIHPKP
jgi:tetratricopeptide (TPR) repeat protein